MDISFRGCSIHYIWHTPQIPENDCAKSRVCVCEVGCHVGKERHILTEALYSMWCHCPREEGLYMLGIVVIKVFRLFTVSENRQWAYRKVSHCMSRYKPGRTLEVAINLPHTGYRTQSKWVRTGPRVSYSVPSQILNLCRSYPFDDT